jgi:hypothetical protein
VKLSGTKAGKPVKIIEDNGKKRVVIDHAKIEAMKPVCARGKSATKQRVVKRGAK